MYLTELHITNFKNISDLHIKLKKGLVVITGLNGTGKTNVLDAIHYLCLTKSAFSVTDQSVIQLGNAWLALKGCFINDQTRNEVACSLRNTEKKVLKQNGTEVVKLSTHIGKFPLVLIHPDDIEIVNEGGVVRRKFFDGLICQLNQEYLDNLLIYNHVLKQRNALLKKAADGLGTVDEAQFEPYDLVLLKKNKAIAQCRNVYVDALRPHFIEAYKTLTDEKEQVSITYETKVIDDNFEEYYRRNFQKEIILQRTLSGIHNDDYNFVTNNFAVRKMGSQGQKKSFLIALKLAQFALIREHTGQSPLLLLDDIFDKLDDNRIKRLSNMIQEPAYEQVFVTDARAERIRDVLKPNNGSIQYYSMYEGAISAEPNK